jgi:hypothetical protein
VLVAAWFLLAVPRQGAASVGWLDRDTRSPFDAALWKAY